MQPIPTLSSPMQLSDTNAKMITQSPILFRPYNHYPTPNAPTFNTLSTDESRVSAFKVVGKRPSTSEIAPETPRKLSRTEPTPFNPIELSKLLAPLHVNRIADNKLLSMTHSCDSIHRNGELCPLNLKKNTLNHETVAHSMRDSNNFEMACDLSVQQQRQKIHSTYQTDVNLSKPLMPFGYTAQGKYNLWIVKR